MNRPGGYLRVIKRGYREGDKAPIAQIEFVDNNDLGKISDDEKALEV